MNIKKLFPEKKLSRRVLLEFFDKKGFYIALILCVAIVAATAVFITTYKIAPSDKDYTTDNITPEALLDNSSAKATAASAIQSPAAPATDSGAAADKTANPGNSDKVAQTDSKAAADTKAAGSKETSAVPKTTFTVPVFGNVTYQYAHDNLAYSKTLEEWRTHDGVDLASERGTPVKAVADGTVSEIKSDPRLGITIIIDHQNGLKTVYANLAAGDMVMPNQIVKQGDIIGSVGNTAVFEAAEQPHLHFEVLKNNVPSDPTIYLPANTQKK